MKFKRFLSLLAVTAMAVTSLTGAMNVSADTDSGDCGESVKWSFDSSTGKLTIYGKGEMASPTVEYGTEPSDYSDIYNYKKYSDSIKEVVIEEGVTSVGFCAFYQMPDLETVVLPKTISKYNSYLPSSNQSIPSYEYSNYGFAECKSLKNLTLSEGMTAIGAYAFYGCTSLESVKIPTSIKEWGYFSFSECTHLKNITLPEGLTVMGSSAFRNTGVESIVIPSTITQWDKTVYRDRANDYQIDSNWTNFAFAECNKLSSVTFKDGLKMIGGGLFANCSSLTKVSIPNSVTGIKYAFVYCSGLQKAYIEEGTKIENGDSYFQSAFANCDNLKKLEIPAGIEISYNNAQWCNGCSSLTDLYIHGQEYGFFPVGNNTSKVHCYSGTKTYNSLISNGVGGIRLEDIQEDMENAQAELNKAVTEAQKYAEEDYTTESYGVLKALLEKAGKYGKDPSIMSMEDTAAGIYAAIDGLIDKSEEPSKPSDSSNPSNPSDNPSDPSNNNPSNPSNPSNNNPTNPKPTTATPNKVTPPAVTTIAKPAKVKNVKVTAKKKKLNVSWKKVSGATGYEVQYAANNKFTKNKKSVTVKKNKIIIKKLKAKKKYFVKIRAYKLANGNKYFGNWSKVVKKKTK